MFRDGQRLVLGRLVFRAVCFTFVALISWPYLVVAESLDQLVASVSSGQLSVDEFADALVILAEENPNLSASELQEKIKMPGIEEILGSRLKSKVEQILLRSGSSENAAGVIALARAVLGYNSAEFEEIDQLYATASRGEQLIRSGNTALLAGFIGSLQSESERSIVIVRLTSFIAGLPEQTQNGANQFAALKQISELDAEISTAEGMTAGSLLLAQAVALIDKQLLEWRQWPGGEAIVREFFEKLLFSGEAEDKFALTKLYKCHAVTAISYGDATSAEGSLNWLTEQKLIAQPELNLLKLELARAASGSSASEFSQRLIADLEGTKLIGASDKVSFLLRGYYGMGLLVGVLVCLGVIILFPLVFFIHWAKQQRSNRRSVGYNRTAQEPDEYSNLLAIFGLTEGASESQIKRAFRDAVKKHHPDSHGATGVVLNQHGEVDETFQELRQAYDRIIEIRGAWFGKSR